MCPTSLQQLLVLLKIHLSHLEFAINSKMAKKQIDIEKLHTTQKLREQIDSFLCSVNNFEEKAERLPPIEAIISLGEELRELSILQQH